MTPHPAPHPAAQVTDLRAYRKSRQPKHRKPAQRLVGTELLKRREEVELRNRMAL